MFHLWNSNILEGFIFPNSFPINIKTIAAFYDAVNSESWREKKSIF